MTVQIVVDVAAVARYLRCSKQRVRLLLSQGRIVATKDDSGAWRVPFPPVIRGGSRGPRLGQRPALATKHRLRNTSPDDGRR